MTENISRFATIRIEKLALGARGLGFLDGISVFVEDCVPGDLVEIEFLKKKKSFAEARVKKILEPSPDRIVPRCQHFGVCGGCAWQFFPYEKQLEWKEQMVRETIEHVGGFREAASESDGKSGKLVRTIIGSDPPWFYRNKMEWSFDAGRNGNEILKGGFHVRKKWHEVVNIEECFLQSSLSVEVFRVIRDFFSQEKAFPRSVFVREGKRTGEMMVVVLSFKQALKLDGLVARLKNFPEIVSVVEVKTGTKRPFEEKVWFGKNFYVEELHVGVGKFRFEVQAQDFFQPNTLMAEKIYEQVLSFAEPKKTDIVFDLFCGTGTIGLTFASLCSSVVGIDSEVSAIESARANAAANGFSNLTYHAGMVQHFLSSDSLASVLKKPDIIILDPPRAGVPQKALEAVAKFRAERIIFVSCNPATFSRDAAYLKDNGYALCTVQPFDQFPHTAHIELVASFSLVTK